MNWLNLIGLNDIESIIVDDKFEYYVKKRNKYNKKNKFIKLIFNDDYDSSWTNYVGIDKKTRESLIKEKIKQKNKSLSINTKKENKVIFKQNDLNVKGNEKKKNAIFLVDHNLNIQLEKNNESNKNNYTNFNLNNINNNNNEINYNNINNNDNNYNNNVITESVNSMIFKKINKLKVKTPELEKTERNNIDILKENKNLNIENKLEENLLKNNKKEEEIKIPNNVNLNIKEINEHHSSQKNLTFKLNSSKEIKISTDSSIQKNYNKNNNKTIKNQIFKVSSIPQIIHENNNIIQLINQKRERENSILNKNHKSESPKKMTNVDYFNNNSPISTINKIEQSPTLFSNQFGTINSIFDDFTKYQFDNISSLNCDKSNQNNLNSKIINKQSHSSDNCNLTIENINYQNNINNKNINLNNNNINEYYNSDYYESNKKINTNKNINLHFKNRLIISKKKGKIIIKSIPLNFDDDDT